MAWDKSSGRRRPLPANWKQLRRDQLELDGYRCTHVREDTRRKCTAAATDVHHYGDDDDHSKLTSLCGFHHRRITGKQGATSEKRVKESRPAEKHPGFIE